MTDYLLVPSVTPPWSEHMPQQVADVDPTESRRSPGARPTGGRARHAPPRHERQIVLVVDDEPSIAELLADLLQSAGYLVLVATNGHEALALIAERQPHLVLSDSMMPYLDGVGLVEHLRASAQTSDLPVVLMSSVRPSRAAMGDVPFLAKPFDLDDVLEIVRRNIAPVRRSPAEA